ncbi:peptidoglycan D,D-transpeptidase FtsI family protein (plasmid) [Agrobacterium rosae]|uniref:Penicillin-binding protein 2 n=2 Tax=Agrobacterium TaxID=357 RepID=A0ABU4W2V9_9HYPH|nr:MULTISPECIES: penicillin-binding protein 2 [Rhizobium/Agrobacterium group]NTF22675.1 penicillin-binding protein 2 [Agrobacterium rubi]MBO0134116.1 penicillin-binding protein 2 [Agrobacterium burrii]MDX8332124.1 penicillin-binding protein 2 [Agrobacterium rosae]NTF29532.1 penicillin-binding protein 2 [Agrobacterium rubi]NTF31873.1 penicillin-binding protein 2 [Rhizobium skierniewicense]
MIGFIVRLNRRAHFSVESRVKPVTKAFVGTSERRKRDSRQRLTFLIAGFAVMYIVVGARLVQYGLTDPVVTGSIHPSANAVATRPDILDRNGELLATDINTVSLYAEPRRIVDADEVVEKLATVLPNLDWSDTHRKLRSGSGFQWLRRQLTPRQQSDILALGIPGIGFRPEKRRFYPGAATASHIVGHVNVDNLGLAGMERYIDQQGYADLRATGLTNDTRLEPVRLSIDVRVQHIVREIAARAITNYQAEAAGAVILDVETGEVIAMASVPDYDPNQPSRTLPDGSVDKEYEKGWFNRISNATFEMGSTFKSFTLAMGLDAEKITLNSVVDASRPIRMGGFTIKDFKGKNRPLSIPEVFQYSSNIGTAAVADRVGIEGHKEFLTRLGLLSKMDTEMPGVATPTQPRTWKKINSVTISFGHGVATTPLQTAVAAAALINGGNLMNPTFLPRSKDDAALVSRAVIKEKTSADMRFLYNWNGLKGSGRGAQVEGFHVGGKTGTADKVINGRYASDINFNAFVAGFPMDKPRYVVLTIIDAPKTGVNGGRTAASTAAPMTKEIIERTAALLDVKPRFGGETGPQMLVNY